MTNEQKKRVKDAFDIWQRKIDAPDNEHGRFDELFPLIWESFTSEEATYFITLLPNIASLEKLTQQVM